MFHLFAFFFCAYVLCVISSVFQKYVLNTLYEVLHFGLFLYPVIWLFLGYSSQKFGGLLCKYLATLVKENPHRRPVTVCQKENVR